MIQDTIKNKLDSARSMSTDDLLEALGLEKKRGFLGLALPAAGIFAAGAAIGAGVALLLAPKSGREFQRQLKSSAKDLTQRIGATAESVAEEVRNTLGVGSEEDSSKKNESSRLEPKKHETRNGPAAMPK